MSLVDNQTTCFSAATKSPHLPLPTSNALCTKAVRFLGIDSQRATTASISCGLYLSKPLKFSVERNSWSHRTSENPCSRAQLIKGLWCPLRFEIKGARSTMGDFLLKVLLANASRTFLITWAGVDATNGFLLRTLNWMPALAKRSRRCWATSVMEPTVDFLVPLVTRCSMATVGDMPWTSSTKGLPSCWTNCLA